MNASKKTDEQKATLEESLKNAVIQSQKERDELKAALQAAHDLRKANEDLTSRMAEAESINEQLLKTILEKDPPPRPPRKSHKS